MKSTKIRNILHTVAKTAVNVLAVLLGVVIIIGNLLYNESVENLLSKFVFKDTGGSVTVNTGKAPVRYKTWYSSVEDNLNGNAQIARLTQAEGTVLLKNADVTVNEVTAPALPLSAGEKVSLYGVTAYDPMYCLDGAGNNKINDPKAYNGKSEVDLRQFFYDEFEAAGFTMNKKLEQWYNSEAGTHYRRYDDVGFWGLNAYGYAGNKNGRLPALTEANWNEIDNNAKDIANFGKNTTAIYVTGRMANESADLNSDGSRQHASVAYGNNDGVAENVDYLAFTDEEKNLLQELGKNYDKVIVLFNQANPPQEDIPKLLDEYGIEAAMWIGFPGSDGIRAVAEVLAGKVNPSGGLSAAWYTSREANPSTQNYAISNFSNIVNMEGMYVGYRYAETRYEDVLLNSENAGTYDYGTQISYPFGYGLSYTTFSYSEVKVVKDNDPAKNYYSGGLMASNDKNYSGNYGKLRPEDERRATGDDFGDCDDLIIEVTVTNTGKVAGKEIVQIYLQQAEAATDKEHGVQKPSVQLVGYGKTSLLAPNQSETVKINIDANKWFAAYDATLNGGENYTGGGYVLAEGDYHLAAARNSHEAVNSIYLKKGGTAANTYINKEYGDGNAANVATVHVDAERSASYKYWTQGTTDEVHNLFQDVAPNTDMVFSRYDWNKTAAIDANNRIGASGKSVSGSANTGAFSKYGPITSDEITAYAEYYDVKFNENAYEFGSSTSTWKLVDLIGVEYDRARGASDDDVKKWSELVGQLTKNEFIDFFKDGLRQTRGIDSIGKPGTNDQNASNGLEWAFGYNDDMGNRAGNATAGFMYAFDSNSKKCYPTGYPCEGIIAATFNNELAYLVGQAIGEDALWAGAAGLYGFGLGLQRNPYHGRAGEFYSDDSFLTGMMGAMETLGAQEKGLYVYNKHFVLNDQETNRTGYKAWIDEQTFRQIYLRPFEMAIEIGDAMNVMIAFNKLGTGWTGNSYNLMTRWLRGEAGMAGFAISDYYAAPGENLGAGMLSGVCLLDGAISTTSGDVVGSLGDARYDNRAVEAMTRILYTVANSNAMNMIGNTTVTYTYEPAWYASRDSIFTGVSVTVYVLFGLSLAFVVGTTTWKLLDQYVFKKED